MTSAAVAVRPLLACSPEALFVGGEGVGMGREAPRVHLLCPLHRGTARLCGVSGSAPMGSGWHRPQMTTQ